VVASPVTARCNDPRVFGREVRLVLAAVTLGRVQGRHGTMDLPHDEIGTGDALLLVPGTGFDRTTWGRFGELAAARFRVITYDRRGFTEAAPAPAANMEANADDAAALLERLDAIPAGVLGWSGGGLVALAHAIEHPHAVRSLTLVEPSLHGLRNVTPSALTMAVRARALKIFRGQSAATDLTYRWTFAYRGTSESAWDRMPADWRRQVLDHAESVAAEEAQETSLPYPKWEAIRDLACPVTVVVGGASHAVHMDAAEELVAAIA